MRSASSKGALLLEEASRMVTILVDLPGRLERRDLSLDAAMSAAESLVSLRLAAGAPLRLTRVDLAYDGLQIGDVFRRMPAPNSSAGWLQEIALGRRLIWLLLAAGEVRAARMAACQALLHLGAGFEMLRRDLTSEEFHLTSVLEPLAEFTYLAGSRTAFDQLGVETVYDRTMVGETPSYTFRGSLNSRPAYVRLPVRGAGDQDRFRGQALDELAVHGREMARPQAAPKDTAPLRLSGLIVLGTRVNLRLRADMISAAARPYLGLVAHLLC